MTPYAVLLAKDTDGDDGIRKKFHVLAKQSHPDSEDDPELWASASKAYNLIKTEALRKTWAKKQKLLAKCCKSCDGFGVKGSRLGKGKIRLCTECGGAGTV